MIKQGEFYKVYSAFYDEPDIVQVLSIGQVCITLKHIRGVSFPTGASYIKHLCLLESKLRSYTAHPLSDQEKAELL